MSSFRLKAFGFMDLISIIYQLMILGFVALASIVYIGEFIGLLWLPVLTGVTLASVAAVHAMQLGATYDFIKAVHSNVTSSRMKEIRKAWTTCNVHTVCSSPFWYCLLGIPLVVENAWVLHQTFPLFVCNALFRILLHLLMEKMGESDIDGDGIVD